MVATAQTSATICGKPLGLATAHTSALIGLETQPIAVEVCATRGPSMFQLVGLAHAAVREARVRVASALAGIGVSAALWSRLARRGAHYDSRLTIVYFAGLIGAILGAKLAFAER